MQTLEYSLLNDIRIRKLLLQILTTDLPKLSFVNDCERRIRTIATGPLSITSDGPKSRELRCVVGFGLEMDLGLDVCIVQGRVRAGAHDDDAEHESYYGRYLPMHFTVSLKWARRGGQLTKAKIMKYTLLAVISVATKAISQLT